MACWGTAYAVGLSDDLDLPGWLWYLLGLGQLGGLGALIGAVCCFCSKNVPHRVVIWGAIAGVAILAWLIK
jgi:hypothetical protein